MPRGGARPGAGRKLGVSTKKMTTEARFHAGPYGEKAIKKAAEMAGLVKGVVPASTETARLSALNIILDRAYGRPKQPVEGEILSGISAELKKFIAGNVAESRSFVDFETEDGKGPEQKH